MADIKYKRVLLKLSGEALSPAEGTGIDTVLEWNPGNHFRDADIRTAKAFAWAMRRAE